MKKNVGKIDSILRLIAALLLVAAAVDLKIWWFGLIGIILLATALIGFCPLYIIFRINTAGKDKKR